MAICSTRTLNFLAYIENSSICHVCVAGDIGMEDMYDCNDDERCVRTGDLGCPECEDGNHTTFNYV